MVATKKTTVILNIIILAFVIVTVFPVLLTIIVSFSSSKSISDIGYSIIPKQWSLEAYKYIFKEPSTIFRAYGVTLFVTIFGTLIAIIVMVLLAYPLSRKDFKLRGFLTIYLLITMLLNGGTVASYMIISNLYNLSNTVWVLIFPGLVNVWYVFVLRAFFQTTIPFSIIESGKLDGASEIRILIKLVLPISLPGIATVSLFQVLYYWNDWYTSLLYIYNRKLYTLQFLLQQMMQNIQMLSENAQYMSGASAELLNVPSENARMALCVVAMGPILCIYPFFQKYFRSGLTMGSVKG